MMPNSITNTAVWSDHLIIYYPINVKCRLMMSAYNARGVCVRDSSYKYNHFSKEQVRSFSLMSRFMNIYFFNLLLCVTIKIGLFVISLLTLSFTGKSHFLSHCHSSVDHDVIF